MIQTYIAITTAWVITAMEQSTKQDAGLVVIYSLRVWYLVAYVGFGMNWAWSMFGWSQIHSRQWRFYNTVKCPLYMILRLKLRHLAFGFNKLPYMYNCMPVIETLKSPLDTVGNIYPVSCLVRTFPPWWNVIGSFREMCLLIYFPLHKLLNRINHMPQINPISWFDWTVLCDKMSENIRCHANKHCTCTLRQMLLWKYPLHIYLSKVSWLYPD